MDTLPAPKEKPSALPDSPTLEPASPALEGGRCGDGVCAGPKNSQSCPQDCSGGETSPTQNGIPSSVFVVHCEPTKANENMWAELFKLVSMADTYAVPLTIDFTAQWAEMILADQSKLNQVSSWLDNGHEIACHHHAYWGTKERGSTWDGYTNTPLDEIDPQDLGQYKGNMEDYLSILNALPGSRTSGCLGCTAHPQDEKDWPCQIQLGTEGHSLEDAVSQPHQVTIGECQVTQIGHALIVSQGEGTLAELYTNTNPNTVFGVVGHVFNYAEFPIVFEEWFKFLHAQDSSGESRFTVSDLLEDW